MRRERQTPRRKAKVWLREVLAGGPQPAATIRQVAASVGLTGITLRRAKGDLGIRSVKAGYESGWLWALPAKESDHLQGRGSFSGAFQESQSSIRTSTSTTRKATPVARVAPPGATSSGTEVAHLDGEGQELRTSQDGGGVVISDPLQGVPGVKDEPMDEGLALRVQAVVSDLPEGTATLGSILIRLIPRSRWTEEGVMPFLPILFGEKGRAFVERVEEADGTEYWLPAGRPTR